jgi:hypothetical protein
MYVLQLCLQPSKWHDEAHVHKKHAGLFIICKHNGHCTEIFRTEAEKSEHILELTNKKDKLMICDFCCVMYRKRDRYQITLKNIIEMTTFLNAAIGIVPHTSVLR